MTILTVRIVSFSIRFRSCFGGSSTALAAWVDSVLRKSSDPESLTGRLSVKGRRLGLSLIGVVLSFAGFEDVVSNPALYIITAVFRDLVEFTVQLALKDYFFLLT